MKNKDIKNIIDNLEVGDEICGLEVTEVDNMGMFTLDDKDNKTFFVKDYGDMFDMIMEDKLEEEVNLI